jgi:hypothetical protein
MHDLMAIPTTSLQHRRQQLLIEVLLKRLVVASELLAQGAFDAVPIRRAYFGFAVAERTSDWCARVGVGVRAGEWAWCHGYVCPAPATTRKLLIVYHAHASVLLMDGRVVKLMQRKEVAVKM